MGNKEMSGVGLTDVLASKGTHGKFKILRPSGWTVLGDTNTGIGVGAFVQGGGGYIEMDIRDIRTSELFSYELRGAYNDIGIGVEAAVEAKCLALGLIKAVKGFGFRAAQATSTVIKGARALGAASDVVVMPGRSLTPLILGINQTKSQLNILDFQYSTWAYLYFGFEVGLGMDFGVMWLLSGGFNDTDFNPLHCFSTCLAFAPYYGTGVSLGAGMKLSLRIINIADVKQIPYSL